MAEVSLFIEDNAIKMLVTRGRRVEKWAKLPLEPGLVSNGLILDETQVAAKLKELFKQQKVGTSTVIAGLSGVNSIYRLISLPVLPEAILPEAVKQEASRIVPVPIDEVYLSYQEIPAEKEETLVFMTAFPKNAADVLLRTLNEAGIRAGTMDLAPLALCRTVNAAEAVVIDARSAGLDIAILIDRVPQVIRSISLSGDTESLAERLPTVVEELERTIAFYNASHQEKPLAQTVPIFVSGDLVNALESWPLLAETLGSSVFELMSPMQSAEGFDSSQFMVNIGLSLKNQSLEKEGSFSLINFNALPEAKPKKKKEVSPYRILTPIGIAIGIGLVFYLGIQVRDIWAENDALRSKVEINQSLIPPQRDAVTALSEDVAAIEPQIDPLQATADIFATTFTSLGDKRAQVDMDLSITAKLAPEEVLDLTSISHNGPWVTVTGTAPDQDDILQYARDLRSSGRYSRVIILSIKADYKLIEQGEDIEEVMVYDFTFFLLSTEAE